MLGKALGPYRIDRQLGSGGMGTVYEATVVGPAPGLAEGSRIAVKVVHPHLLEAAGFFKRFLREADLGRAVRHPNVVRTLDADALRVDGQQRHFLVMEYVEGQTLRDLKAELERVPEELCCRIGRDVARGLAAIHAAGAVHRDIKPENVLLTRDHVVKIMDLGVARLAREDLRLSMTGAFVGSLHYAAPEQFMDGGRNVDGRADLHALGLVLYELATGRNPYDAADFAEILRLVLRERPPRLGEVDPSLSAFFDEVVHRLLEKDPGLRFATADDLEAALDERERSAWWRGRAPASRPAARHPLRRPPLLRETVVQGREEPLAELRGLYDRASAGEGRVVLLTGEPGIGRSRLVDELVRRLDEDAVDLEFLYGAYPPGGAATASGAISSAFRERLGEAGAAAFLAQTPLLVPAFDAFLRGEPAAEGTEPLTKESLQTCFVQVAKALARERPTVVFVDDLHFAPEEGRALFAALAMAAPGQRLLVVGGLRSGSAPDWQTGLDRLVHVRRMELGRLGEAEVGRILTEALGSADLAEKLAAPLHRKSDGNPYFLFEILGDLREGGYLAKSAAGTWRLTRPLDGLPIPATVLEAVRSRVAGLGEQERDLLDVAACVGFRFDPALVGEVLGIPGIPALKEFSRIERRHRLVHPAGREMEFDHHQVQEALYGAIHLPLREEYHGLLARTIEARAAPERPSGPLAVQACGHHLSAGRPGEALRHLAPALDHLEGRFRTEAAADLAGRVLGAPGIVAGRERLDLLLRTAAHLDTLGRPDDLARVLADAEILAGTEADRGPMARVLAARGWSRIARARYEEARDLLARARALAVEAGDEAIEAAATRDLGIAYFCLSRLEEARECHERHLDLAVRLGDRREQAKAKGNLGNVLFGLGRRAAARERYEEWLAVAREQGDRRSEAAATGNLGTILFERGEWVAAREHHERYRTLCREIGYRHGVVRACLWIGREERALGRYEEALRELTRSAELARALGQAEGHSPAEVELAETLAESGDLDAARSRIAGALARIDALDSPTLRGQILRAAGRVAAAAGDADEAEERLKEAAEVFRTAGGPGPRAETLLALGEVVLAAGRPGEAEPTLREARELAESADLAGVGIFARVLLASMGKEESAPVLADLRQAEGRLTHDARRKAWLALRRAAGCEEDQ